jgi:hypothetical protein
VALTKRRWTLAEVKYLRWHWGTTSVPALAAHFDRTKISVIRKAADLQLGGVKRGRKSLRQIAAETGYALSTILIAIENLGVNLRRVDRGDRVAVVKHRHIVIDIEQEEQILAYLRVKGGRARLFRDTSLLTERGTWGIGKKPLQCEGCERSDRPHYAKGKCKVCYNRAFKYTLSLA